MLVNADFSRRAVVTTPQQRWIPSPQTGVERIMLDRMGAEKGRATSIVKYVPGSQFPSHMHPGGEEIFVLDGTFCEGDKEYPAGWYLRNPPGSAHQPSSAEGAVIFVKLWQMPSNEAHHVRINTNDPANWENTTRHKICRLFSSESETVFLQRLGPGEILSTDMKHGTEILVVSGTALVEYESLREGEWMRFPPGDYPTIAGGPGGTKLYVKTGHLKGMGSEQKVEQVCVR